MRKESRHIREMKASMIESNARQAKKPIKTYQWSVKSKKAMIWMAGRCKVCGECYEVLTNVHAERCGFKNKEEMVKAGAVEPVQIGGMCCVEDDVDV